MVPCNSHNLIHKAVTVSTMLDVTEFSLGHQKREVRVDADGQE